MMQVARKSQASSKRLVYLSLASLESEVEAFTSNITTAITFVDVVHCRQRINVTSAGDGLLSTKRWSATHTK